MTKREAILTVLAQGEAYGQEIRERAAALDVKFHQGNLYPLLRDMEAEGVLASREGDPVPERGNRPRRYYRRTL